MTSEAALIIYVDSSTVVNAYLEDEPGHFESVALLTDSDTPVMSGTLTPLEVAGALVRAARAGRGDRNRLLAMLGDDIGHDGPVTILSTPQEQVEARAMQIVCETGLRAIDAWHIAAAEQLFHAVGEPGESLVFATRDKAQGDVARTMGFEVI
jgi:uncharacterized protein